MSTRKPRGRIARIFWLLAAVAMIVAVMPLAGAAADGMTTVDLIVDGGTDSTTWVDIGEVQVSNDAENLYVKYVVDTEWWCLTSTAVDIDDGDGFATTKKGAPKIGKFESKAEHDCVTEYEHTIPLAGMAGDIQIAAHADTLLVGGLEGVEMALPDQVQMKVRYPYGGAPSYFETTVVGDPLSGIYEGWCIDTHHTIGNGTWYTANVSSSYGAGSPANMDQVNWIVNQGYVGTVSPGGYGMYTYGDVQRAIWTLVDPNSTSGLGSWSQLRVDEILAAAALGGPGYEPGCGDVVAVILNPVNAVQVTIAQTTFIELGVPCDDREETAWGGVWTGEEGFPGFFGDKFVEGSTWAGYFTYTIMPPMG